MSSSPARAAQQIGDSVFRSAGSTRAPGRQQASRDVCVAAASCPRESGHPVA